MVDGAQARQVQDELEAALEADAEQRRLTARRERARAEAEAAARALAEARATHRLESQDVARLESFSPTRIWAGLRGSRDTDLAREQAEEQAAAYAVSRAQARVQAADAELAAVQGALAALGDVPARRERALAAKERLLTGAGGADGAELESIATELGSVRSQLTEVREALGAAAAAADRLAQAATELGKARSWSTYDTFFDGGVIGDMMKYDRVDQAAALMREADRALRRLSTELADVGMGPVGGVEVTGMVRAFDVWFDNIFSDWSVRNRITEAARRTDDAAAAVHQVRGRLTVRAEALAGSEARLRTRREELLLATT